MPFLRAQVRIPRDTGFEADVITNNWHFDVDNGTAAAAAAEAQNALDAFYGALDTYLPTSIVNSPAEVRWYDLADPEPREPIYTDTIALTTNTGSSYPAEVAICLSYQGAAESGANMRRRRGRLYLGPLLATAGEQGAGRTIVASAVRTALASAATSVKSYTGTLGVSWAVFSPTTYAETGNLDAAFEDVVSGWIDDEFDIQRRRGSLPATRTTWS